MRNIVIAICFMIGSACRADDPISNLVQSLDGMGMWMNGPGPSFAMPANSSPTQVIMKAAQAWKIVTETKTIKILEIRTVKIKHMEGPYPWVAAIVDCNSSKKILLYQCIGTNNCPDGIPHWWSKFYDFEENKPNKNMEVTR